MAEKDNLKPQDEIESLNKQDLDVDGVSAEQLEEVSGGGEVPLDTSCGSFSCGLNFSSDGPIDS
jgi:hypothetical protein